jgi:drug/metabolite transporter (DMT)-like permease
MKSRHAIELMLLAAIWGASFLFTRIAVPAFGPFALAGLRVAGAAMLLLPLLLARGESAALRRHWRPILLLGLTNSGLPFLCFGFAALAINSGLSSIFNAATPLWGALIAWVWLGDRPTPSRWVGLGVGFVGVLWLAGGQADFKPGASGMSTGLAALACLAATAMYAFSASFTKRHLVGVPPMVLACGSQLSATLLLVPLAVWQWPAHPPSGTDWAALAALAWLCTGLAYVLFFHLIAQIGAANTITVTFLIPAFAVAWGTLFLGEHLQASTLGACALIFIGTALLVGWMDRWWKPNAPLETKVTRPN